VARAVVERERPLERVEPAAAAGVMKDRKVGESEILNAEETPAVTG
jgi:hypothetical protein